MTLLLTLICGGSATLCLLLLFIYFLAYPFREDPINTRVGAVLLIGCVGAQQVTYGGYFLNLWPLVELRLYGALLCAQVAGFYLFSAGVLGLPDHKRIIAAIHIPMTLFALMWPNPWIIPISFAMGGSYAAYFNWRIFQLRDQYPRRALELKLYLLFAVVALAMTILGLLLAFLPTLIVGAAHVILVWAAVLVVVLSLIKYPDWVVNSRAIARARYAQSTLSNVDCGKARAMLETLLADPLVTRDTSLNLRAMAARVKLSPHQLSELVNTEYHCGFSELLRRHRVADAKRQLLAEPDSSVLAIGLATGFSSQSNFYSAFRDQEGCTPGAYRQQAAK